MISPRADAKVLFLWPGVTWVLALGAWLSIASISPAQVDGWGTDGGPGTPPTTYTSQSTYGVTVGSNALQATTNQGGFWGPSTGNLMSQGFYSALANAKSLSFDLTLIGTQINGGNPFSGFAQSNEVAVQLYSNPGGSFPSTLNVFSQQSFSQAGVSDSSGQNATWSGVDGTRTIVFNLADFMGTDTDGTTKTIGAILMAHPDSPTMLDAKIDFVEQIGGGSAATGNFFFDNVRLLDGSGNTLATIGNFEPVPEPSSLALVAVAVPSLIAVVRRRRKLGSSPAQPETVAS